MQQRHFLVVVCGLLAEARLAHPAPGRAIAGGGDPSRLETELERALSEGAGAVLSFGLAAGLAPGLAPGTLVIPDEIVSGPARYATDRRWSERMRSALGGADARALAGVDAPLVRSADKMQLHAATDAAAADMESHLAARLAQRAGRPFAALRAVSDAAGRSLPPAALAAMQSDGGVDVAAVIASVVRDPLQLPELVRVAGGARTAMRVLGRCRRVLGPGFGWSPAA
jgi:hopanoid-associated phosphorylase